MEKAKKEKIALLILLPIFVLGLVVKLVGKTKLRQQPIAPAAVSAVEQEKYIKTEAKVFEELKSRLKKVEYKAEEFSDPFKNRLSAYIASIGSRIKKKITEKTAERIEPELPQLNITGLIWNTDKPQAIVNGSVLSVGDEIDGTRLLSVDKDGITVEYKGFEFFIEKQAGIASDRNIENENGHFYGY